MNSAACMILAGMALATLQGASWDELFLRGSSASSSEEAVMAFRSALVEARTFPAVDPRIGITLDRLAVALSESGETHAAVVYARRAADFWESNPRSSLADKIASNHNLGCILMADGSYDRALTALGRALSLLDLIAQPKPWERSKVLGSMGIARFKLGEYYHSEKLIRDSLLLLDDSQTEHDVERGNAYSNLGKALGAQHRMAEARDALRQAVAWLEPHREEGGLQRRSYGRAAANLGMALLEDGFTKEALNHFPAAIGALEAGPLQEDYLVCLDAYARALRKAGNRKEANRVDKRVREVAAVLSKNRHTVDYRSLTDTYR